MHRFHLSRTSRRSPRPPNLLAPPPENETGEKPNGGQQATFSNVIEMLQGAYHKLQGAYHKLQDQNIKTPAAVKIKGDVCSEIIDAIELIKTMREEFGDNATTSLPAIKAEIKKLFDEKARTYAQVMTTPTSKPAPDPKALKVREQKTATRQERVKCEVTLTSTTEQTKKSLI